MPVGAVLETDGLVSLVVCAPLPTHLSGSSVMSSGDNFIDRG